MKIIKNIRLKYYDYARNGYYFITICSNKRFPNLPQLETVIKNNLESLSTIDGVMLDYWVIMPDHIHIIVLLKNCRMKLGEIIRRFKAKISKESGCKVWQSNYYEHIIRNEKALQKIRAYIQSNPMVGKIDFEQFYK